MANDKIKAKIAALLAKAEGTDNPFEAETFMAKVNELLEEHQIEMHEVRKEMGRDDDPMGKDRGDTNIYASILWARQVAGILASYYGCKFIYWRKRNHFIYDIIGRESARTTFELMLPFIISQVKLQAKRLWLTNGDEQSLSVWEREVGQALYSRINQLYWANKPRREELESKALVPVDDVQAYADSIYSDVKIKKAPKLKYGYEAQEAAKRVSLHVQATGRGKTKLLEK